MKPVQYGASAVEGDCQGPAAVLWKRIELGEWSRTFLSLGDLDNDGRVDFLLHRCGPLTTPAWLGALDHDGRLLWQRGNPELRTHATQGYWHEPPCRGMACAYDVDGDGKTEVVAELWEAGRPNLYILDGSTGEVKYGIPSPLTADLREPAGYECWRPSPHVLIAHLHGPDAPPAIVLKYEASGRIPCHAFAFDHQLQPLWHIDAEPHAMGHMGTVCDIDGDGCTELLLGQMLAGADGQPRWVKTFGSHADFTAAQPLCPGEEPRLFMSICGTGPAYCLDVQGNIIWQASAEEVTHGQGMWVGRFIEGEPGMQAIILKSGHVGDFLTLDAATGATIATFTHLTQYEQYPDTPMSVRWSRPDAELLYLPVDRALVDGRGRLVADLGSYDAEVREALGCGNTKKDLAAQAFPVDLCGDAREELVLYQPYNGTAIFIFTQEDGGGQPKPYVAPPHAYNYRTYF